MTTPATTTTLPATSSPSSGPPSARSLASRLAGVAGYLDRLRGGRQRGPLAELRRLRPLGTHEQQVRPGDLPGETFWALVQRFDIAPGEEEFWLAVLPLMVRHPHQRGLRPGRALEAANISKARFERWLRLDRETGRREAGRLLSKLKDQGLDWVELGHVLYGWSDDDRYRLARDFFLARERREYTSTDGAE